jgi:ribose/xylose/arabinose/galactoside ABC-type transport system permease subunit
MKPIFLLFRTLGRTEWALLLAVGVVVLLTGLLDQQHDYWHNPRESAVVVLRQTSLLGIFALGAAVVIVSGGIDLSSGSVIAFSGTVCASLLLLLAPDEMLLKVKWYRLDADSLTRLEQEEVPPDLVSRLRPLTGQTFKAEDAFRAALQERLPEEAFKEHAARLVGLARFNKPLGLGVIALAIAGTLVVGLLVGSLHAWLITVIDLPPFVATLATLVGLRSFARALAETVTLPVYHQQKYQIEILDPQFRYLATSVWIPVVLFAVLAALLWGVMSRTVVGRHLHALGGNEQAARLSGIRTDGLKWLAYCVSAVLASFAGILYVADQAVAAPQTLGQGYELNAIAAAVVGGCSLQGGVGTIPGTVLGALFLRTVIDGVARIIKTGANVYEGMIVGGVVVVAVALTQVRAARRRGKRFFEGGLGLVTMLNLTLLAGALAWLMGERLVGSVVTSVLNLFYAPARAAELAAAWTPRGTVLGLAVAGLVVALLILARLLEWRRRAAATGPGERK